MLPLRLQSAAARKALDEVATAPQPREADLREAGPRSLLAEDSCGLLGIGRNSIGMAGLFGGGRGSMQALLRV